MIGMAKGGRSPYSTRKEPIYLYPKDSSIEAVSEIPVNQ